MSNLEDRKRGYQSESSSTTSSVDRPAVKKAKPSTREDESRQIAGAEAARIEAGNGNRHEADSSGSKKVKIKLIVTVPSKRKEEQEPARPKTAATSNQSSFHNTFPGMPAPNLADVYQIPPHIQGHLAILDTVIDARQRAKDDAHTLSGRRSLWAKVIAAAKEQGMTKEQWEGDFFEDTDLTPPELYRVVLLEEQKRVQGKQRELSYHIESDEEHGWSG